MKTVSKSWKYVIAGVALLAALAIGGGGMAAPTEQWGGAWGYATSPATRSVRKQMPAGTYRYRIRLSQTGDALQLTLVNPDGAKSSRVTTMTVAAAADGGGFEFDPATLAPVTFAGEPSPTLAPGEPILSDAVPFTARSGHDIIVSIAFDAPTTALGARAGMPVAFAKNADLVSQADDAGFDGIDLRPLVTFVSVRNPPVPCTIVALGDSITEGVAGRSRETRGWPGRLAERLEKEQPRAHCGVVNMGISGNRVLADGRGTAAIDRFARDVESVPNVTTVILLEGINDIAKSGLADQPEISARMLVTGYLKIIDMAHAKDIRILGGTMTPAFGSRHIPAEKEEMRLKANAWIRQSGAFDGLIDFEKAIGDGRYPPRIRKEFDSGGQLHPTIRAITPWATRST